MKIRRTVATAVTAAAIALAPTAAFAYGAEDYTNTGTVSDTTPALGTPVTVSVQGPANTPVTLTITTNPASIPDSAITIAGTRSLTKNTDAAGSAAFSVTISQGGSYTAVVLDAVSGEVLSTQTLAVAAGAGGTAAAPGDDLAVTGSATLPVAISAGALVALGASGVLFARRRRQSQLA